MNKFLILILSYSFFLLSGCQTKQEENKIIQLNDSVYEIGFPPFKAKIDVNASGRIISYTNDGFETLTDNRSHPFNYGSTLWPSPQDEWNWPPPPSLDGEPYMVFSKKSKLELASKISSQTGLQFTKEFYFDNEDSALVINYTIINKNDTARYAEAWEVTRVPGNLSFFPLYKDSIYDKSNLKSTQNIDGILWYEHNWDSLPKSQKIFADAVDGWTAHVTRDNLLFIKKFDDIPLKSQSPGQGEIEIYAASDFDYIELENHGERKMLKPNELLKYEVRWYLTKIPSEISIQPGSIELIDYTKNFIQSKKQ